VSGAKPPSEQKDYREEAKRIRALASDVKNPFSQAQLELIASLYEKLADHVANEGNRPPNKEM
jgi:hypothetical protein